VCDPGLSRLERRPIECDRHLLGLEFATYDTSSTSRFPWERKSNWVVSMIQTLLHVDWLGTDALLYGRASASVSRMRRSKLSGLGCAVVPWPILGVKVGHLSAAWSIGVMIDRWIAFSAARKQSRQFAPAVAGALREGKLDEAIRVAERNKKSHLAKVVTAGLQEFKAHGESTEIPGEQIEASKRALERAEAIVHAELKRGLGGLATIGSTAPFVGLFGTVIGILNAFRKISEQKATGLGAVAGGISEALVTTALGLFVAIPAVMMFNYFTGKVEAFDVEMDNSSSELVDYFLKRTNAVRR
jgi:biopolymer transport protein ExbB